MRFVAPNGVYFQAILTREDIDRNPWGCFALIDVRARRNGIESSRLTLMDAAEDFVMDRWLLTFRVDQEAQA